jgi:hypothetical protein
MTSQSENAWTWFVQPRALVLGVLVSWMLLSVFCHAPLRQEMFIAQHGLQPTTTMTTATMNGAVAQQQPNLDSVLLALLTEQIAQRLQIPTTQRGAAATQAVSSGWFGWDAMTRVYARVVDGLLARLFFKGPALIYAHAEKRPAEICGDGKKVEHWLETGRSECNIALFEKFETFCTTMQWCLLGVYVIWLLCFSRDVRTYVHNTIQWPANMQPTVRPQTPHFQPQQPTQPPFQSTATTTTTILPAPPSTRITPGGPVRIVSLQRKAAAAATAAAILKQRQSNTNAPMLPPALPEPSQAIRPFSI